jgi:isoleucyl-tRNA synthetase
VHLCDWPAVDESLINEELSASVRLVQRIVSLGRSARSKANIRVRQPLATVHVKVASEAEGATLRRLADQVLDELNVKTLDVMDDEAAYFDYQVRPNLPVLGPKYGGEVGRIQRALAQADKADIARAAGAGQKVELDGFSLEPGELLVTISGKPGYAAAEEAGYAVAVSTEITPELADEGLARELVRRIQEMRKSAGFEIADRIRLGYEGDADVDRVMREHGEYISQEVLAASIEPAVNGSGQAPSSGSGEPYAEEHSVDGRQMRLVVQRVG